MDLSPAQLSAAALGALLVGFSKTGITGLGVLIVPLMATVFPARESTGALLPMLLVADVVALVRYRRHANWPILIKLLPWIVPGLLLGYLVLGSMSDSTLYPFLGGMVLSIVGVQVVRERGGEWFEEHLPRQWWFSALMGLLAGFATMVGNVAGAIMGIYLISMGLEKREFMGTGAWYYLIVNAAKVPLSAHLGLITAKSLAFNAAMTPLILIGAFAGIAVFHRIPQRWFNRAILLLAALAALRMLMS